MGTAEVSVSYLESGVNALPCKVANIKIMHAENLPEDLTRSKQLPLAGFTALILWLEQSIFCFLPGSLGK